MSRSGEPNWLDRVILAVAPSAGQRRIEARAKAAAITKAVALYDGARRSYRTSGRVAGTTSANSEIERALGRLRDVSRDLVRNNPYAARAVSIIASNVVGAGIVPRVEAGNEKIKKRLQKLIKQHLETKKVDFDGRHDFYGLQALVMRTVVESGEALIIRRRAAAARRLPVPLQIQVLEPDYIDQLMDGPASDGGRIVQGIEFDKAGQRVAYWLHGQHPGDKSSFRSTQSVRVPAEDVIHVYRVDRPGQTRGVPWFAPAIVTLSDLAEYEDAELVRQKIAACFAVFWVDSHGTAPKLTGDTDKKSDQGLPTSILEPGLQQMLPPGLDVKFATPPTVQGYAEYIRAQIRKIAIAIGLPYEALAGDLSQVNFSGGRMGWLEFLRSIDLWRWSMLIPHACDGVSDWFLEAAAPRDDRAHQGDRRGARRHPRGALITLGGAAQARHEPRGDGRRKRGGQ
jgi:lambda family phage portal protein